ncbi:MAG: DUF4097 family beta strand repeat protein [Firmicutes bacterium]|nr:DUF4097 family beta strand repeat protein [Bacillota bacterium]
MKKNIYLVIITIVTILLILVGVIWNLGPLFDISLPWDRTERSGSDGEKNSEAVTQVWEESELGECSSIRISFDAADVILEKGDQCSIRYKGKQKLLPTVKAENGNWIIEQKVKNHISFGIHNLRDNQLVITLPEGMIPQSVEVKGDAGDINFRDIPLQRVRFETDAGDIDLERVEIQDLEIDTDAGDIDIVDSNIVNGRITADAGDLKMTGSSFTNLTGELDAGDVHIESPVALDDADLDLKVDLGDLRVNKQDHGNSYQQQGTSGIHLDMSVDMGDVKISW